MFPASLDKISKKSNCMSVCNTIDWGRRTGDVNVQNSCSKTVLLLFNYSYNDDVKKMYVFVETHFVLKVFNPTPKRWQEKQDHKDRRTEKYKYIWRSFPKCTSDHHQQNIINAACRAIAYQGFAPALYAVTPPGWGGPKTTEVRSEEEKASHSKFQQRGKYSLIHWICDY
jgi:hypothetical protein